MDPRMLLVLIAAAASMSACASDEMPINTLEVSDSAGVPVVINPPPGPGTPFYHLSSEPTVVIGDAARGPGHELFGVTAGTVLDDGTIVIANSGTRELRYYDPSGTYLGAGGRQGEGPGEMMALSLVGSFAGDSLLVWDMTQRRFSVFGPKGSFARSFRGPEGRVYGMIAVGVLADGRPVVTRREVAIGDPSATTGVERRPASILILPDDGGTPTEIGPFPGSEISLVIGDSGPATFGVIFGRSLHAAGRGQVIAAGNNDAYSIRRYRDDGTLTDVVRQRREPLSVQPGDFEQALPEVMRPDSPPSPAKARFEANIEQMPRYPTLPAFGSSDPRGLRFDQTGNLWIEEYQPPGDESPSWQAFDSEGRLLGRLDLPDGVVWLDIGPGWILTRLRDELDVDRVLLYGLEAPKTSDEQ